MSRHFFMGHPVKEKELPWDTFFGFNPVSQHARINQIRKYGYDLYFEFFVDNLILAARKIIEEKVKKAYKEIDIILGF